MPMSYIRVCFSRSRTQSIHRGRKIKLYSPQLSPKTSIADEGVHPVRKELSVMDQLHHQHVGMVGFAPTEQMATGGIDGGNTRK